MQFRGEYAFLSNFYSSPIRLGEYTFPTAEHAFQAQKDPSQAHLFALHGEDNELPAYYSTPSQAKKAGHRLRLRPDWYRVRVAIMTEIVWAKFDQNPELRKCLTAIEDKTIAEDNTWGDCFWGRVYSKGQN